ncbi:MAG: type IIL restriction-modification enzyme MmeI [Verrucomicrobiaceae bacterium]
MSDHASTLESFIAHWSKGEANERANSQTFLLQLTQMLGVPAPSNTHEHGYSFEFPVKVSGTSNTNFLDLYRRAHFALKSKQFAALREEQSELALVAQKAGVIEGKAKSGPVRGTAAWDDAMIRARGQAELTLPKGKAGKPRQPLAPPLRSPRAKPAAKTAWLKPLADRIRATEQALHAAGHPVTAEELTSIFARAKPVDLQEILDSLVTLGRAHRCGEKFSV